MDGDPAFILNGFSRFGQFAVTAAFRSQVDDDGAGFDPAPYLQVAPEPVETDSRPSIGLRNVDERLRMLYGESYRLRIESTPGEGTRVVFQVPLFPELSVSTESE